MNTEALRRARELRGMSCRALALSIGSSPALLSQVETGRVAATPDLTRRIAGALDVPVEFLLRTPWRVGEGSFGLFRAYSTKVSKTDSAQVRQRASVIVELFAGLQEGVRVPEPCISCSVGAKVSDATRSARALLGYTESEPIRNLTRRLEKLGAVVAKDDLKKDAVFGYSFWVHGKHTRPFVVISHFQTPYRARWTLAHELGHLIMGHEFAPIDAREADTEADQFAADLLVPEQSFVDDLEGGSSISAFAKLKARYGVSIAALVRRARDLSLIDHVRYESLNVQMSQKGWKKSEPGDDVAPYEEPLLLRQLANHRFGDRADSLMVATALGLPLDVVQAVLCESSHFKELMRLRDMLA